MSLFRGSRYSKKTMIQSNTATESLRFHPLRETTRDLASQSYITRAGDTFESLAFKHYGDGNRWWVIADANPEIFFPLDLLPGVEIKLPLVSEAALL